MRKCLSVALHLSFTIFLISMICDARAGNAPTWKWVRGYDSIAAPAGIGTMKIDKDGLIYMSGAFTSSPCYLGPYTLLRQDTTSFTFASCSFIARLDSFGNVQWAIAYGSKAGNSSTSSMDMDSAGNIYVTGVFDGTLTMNGQTLIQRGNNIDNVFIVKLTSSGTVVWAKAIYAVPASIIEGPVLAVDKANDLILAMSVTGTNELVSGTDTLSLSGSPGEQLALYKLSATGALIYSKSFYTNHQSLDPSGICIDSGNNILLSVAVSNVNQIAETIQLDTVSFIMPPIFQGGGILLRFSPTATCLWGSFIGGWSYTSSSNGGFSIVLDQGQHIYAAGAYDGDTARFGNTLYIDNMPAYYKAYLAKFDLSGNLIWANTIPHGNARGGNLVVDARGNCFLSGVFADTFLVVNNISIQSNLVHFGTGYNNFIIDYDKNGTPLWGKGYGWPYENLPATCVPAILGNSVYEAGAIQAAYFDGLLVPYSLFLGKLGNTFSLSASSVNMNCSDSCTGSATAAVIGQTGPVSYSWAPGHYTTATVSGLCAGTYTCVALDSIGDHDTAVVSISVLHASPAVPGITAHGDTLSVPSGYLHYQWAYNNTAITPDTAPVIITSQNGNYTVAIIDTDGCSAVSAPYPFANTGIVASAGDNVWLYPNPSNGGFFIQSSISAGSAYTISDLTGRAIQTGLLTGGFTAVTLPSQAPGIYVVTFPGLSAIRPVRITIAR